MSKCKFVCLFHHYFKAVNSVMCGTFRNFTHESNLWMSAGGTRSVIHYDADENIHCMLAGRKDFMVVEEKYEAPLYFMDLVWFNS